MKILFHELGNIVQYLLKRKTVFELGFYRESELTRLMTLFAHVDLEKWQGMKILEVGAGLGHIGAVFEELGFDVTSTDGREEQVEAMRKRGRKAFVLDLDKQGVDTAEEFDIVLAFGVLYHLTEPARFIQSCGKRCKVLVLETAVSDLARAECPKVVEAKGWRGRDQALNEYGCRPSPAWVEEECRRAGFESIRDISGAMGNWVKGVFDWEPRNSGKSSLQGVNFRKMWVCEKG